MEFHEALRDYHVYIVFCGGRCILRRFRIYSIQFAFNRLLGFRHIQFLYT